MNDLQELRSLKLAYREGGDLRDIIDRLLDKTKRSPFDSPALINSLISLKDKVDNLAQRFLKGALDRNVYTLEWDELVRDTMKIIDQLEKELDRA